jgi:hypothetical protein
MTAAAAAPAFRRVRSGYRDALQSVPTPFSAYGDQWILSLIPWLGRQGIACGIFLYVYQHSKESKWVRFSYRGHAALARCSIPAITLALRFLEGKPHGRSPGTGVELIARRQRGGENPRQEHDRREVDLCLTERAWELLAEMEVPVDADPEVPVDADPEVPVVPVEARAVRPGGRREWRLARSSGRPDRVQAISRVAGYDVTVSPEELAGGEGLRIYIHSVEPCEKS